VAGGGKLTWLTVYLSSYSFEVCVQAVGRKSESRGGGGKPRIELQLQLELER